MQREWDRLRYKSEAIARARSWDVTDRHFEDLDGLLALCGFRTATTVEAEAILRRLVIRAAADELAGRVVLQRVLPGLLAVMRRNQLRSTDDVLEHLVAAAWIVIRTFVPSRRPACLAAAIISEADHACFCRPGRRMSLDERTFDPVWIVAMPDQQQPSTCEELAGVLAEARAAGVPAAELDFVRHLLRAGSPGQVASELGVTTRTIRNRRERVMLRLRQATLAA